MRRILSIDGGGIRGVFPASFLASLEDAIQDSVANYFDLIVGTSTGGIIALGLGLGYSAKQMLTFYEIYGPQIFAGSRLGRTVRHLFLTKYNADPLRRALQETFGDKRLGESLRRLIIPSSNLDTGEVHIWKTAHHPRFETDYRAKVVDIALATAAAPTYFPAHRLSSGTPLVDGGMWANNPVGVSVVEAVGVLEWPTDEILLLSLGCTSTPLNVKAIHWGWGYWGPKIVGVFMSTQSSAAVGTATHLLANRNNLIRICPSVGDRFALDLVTEIPSLKGLGASEARKETARLRPLFFTEPAEVFEPFHVL